ncbi:class I SAM-dependent methyltransferase [Luteimonas yindakuii]|uniref:class I SAM-dependent methyltransferase n=1 Tax=Luteimonas yindakuii TaxID=2565782 RepID=UPI001FCA1C7C|nr:methyltransferase [Luteimonas yindakuii]
MKPMLFAPLLSALLVACGGATAVTADPAADTPARADTAAALDRVIAGSWRTPEFVARDGARHPKETLSFFGIRPEMTVVEIAPGGGWYMELLAPYLRERGTYVGAIVDPATVAENRREAAERGRRALAERQPASVFDRATIHGYDPAAPRFGTDGSADAVLTFRNVHNWLSAGNAQAMFEGFHKVLKPGGVLGVVEHRADRELPADDRSGYAAEQTVIALAEAAGFRLDARSEINANPADTRDHPNGVWTLPPTNRHDAADAAKYRAIGESDRMTLRFVRD